MHGMMRCETSAPGFPRRPPGIGKIHTSRTPDNLGIYFAKQSRYFPVKRTCGRSGLMNFLPGRNNLGLILAGIFLFSLPFSHTVALRLITLFTAAAIALVDWRRQNTPPVPCKLPLALWAGMAVLSLTWAIRVEYSFNEIMNEIVYSVVAFLTFYSLTATQREWRIFTGTMVAGFAVVAVVAVYWFAMGYDETIDSPHGGVGPHSTYLVIVLPLLMAVCLRTPSRGIPASLIWVLIPLLLLDGYGTRNRALWPAIAISIAVLAGLDVLRRRSIKVVALTLAAAALLVVFAGAQFVDATLAKNASTQKNAAGTLSVDAMVNMAKSDPRIALWKFSFDQIRQRPLTGAGFGRGAMGETLTQHFQKNELWHAHNIFLNYAIEMGLGGVVVLVLLFFAFGREFWKLYRAGDDTASLIGAAGIALLAGFITKNLTDDFFVRQNALLFWSIVGMSLGYGKRRTAGKQGD
jgi:O-antigen ligase